MADGLTFEDSVRLAIETIRQTHQIEYDIIANAPRQKTTHRNYKFNR